MVNDEMKENKDKPRGKSSYRRKPKNGAGKPTSGPKQVTWPKEYTEFASHPVQYALGRAYNFGDMKGIFRKAIRISMGNVIPTDRDHEFYDSVTNQYKILKSLTSGARFYNQNTLYALTVGYRKCVLELARACGLMNALEAKLKVENAPAHAAWNIIRDGIGSNYITEIENLPGYRQKLAEAVSELNSIPMPNSGGLEDFFKYYSHVYRDDHGKASDYYVFTVRNADDVNYADNVGGQTPVPGHMTTVNHAVRSTTGIASLLDDIIATCGRLRASLDINNLMADLIGVFPSSRVDWAPVIVRHKDFERQLDASIATALSSAPLLCANVSTLGEVSTAGDNIEFQYQDISNPPANWKSHVADDQWVDTKAGATEVSCYDFQVTVEGTGSGGAVQSTDRVDTTGFVLCYMQVLTDIGTSNSAPSVDDIYQDYNNTNSTVQSTAEEGAKRLAIACIQFRALPKLDMWNFGTGAIPDDAFWNPEDIRLVAKVDLANNLKTLNMVRFNTTHLTTEKQR